MDRKEVVSELKGLGAESYKRILVNHGAKEPVLGVKISDLKKIQKQVKKDYRLSLDLYDTGIYDAQYLAGLIADEAKITIADLRHWVATANCFVVAGTVVAWVAAESRYGGGLALDWIDSKEETVAETGWATLGGLVAIRDDGQLDLDELTRLLARVEKTIHHQPNRVRYAMNSFVICLGSYVSSLTRQAIKTGESIGTVSVDMGPTACKVPYAPDYIRKVQQRGTIGKKRKTVRC
jgi:3-methyladenine DNA glycosylase AlkD